LKRLLLIACGTLVACTNAVLVDAGQPDSGGVGDAGTDAGFPHHDAGVLDAGFHDVAIADWCSTFALAQCERDERCGRINDDTMPACLKAHTLGCDPIAYQRSAQENKLQYDESAAADCLNSFGFGSCEFAPDVCGRVFLGLTPPNDGCFVPEDCDPDAGFCDPYDGLCPHRCSPWVDAGQDCNGVFSPRCANGLGCDNPPDGGDSTVCMPAHQLGESCIMFDSCADGLTCSSGICLKQYAAIGAACDVTDGFPYCDDSAFCHQPPPATPGGFLPPASASAARA
jgi:hypothetical protein